MSSGVASANCHTHVHESGFPADDVGCRRSMVRSDKHGIVEERAKQSTGHELEVQNKDL